MSRPQLTLSLLLGLLAWALSAMPAPLAVAGPDAHELVEARMCGWLDIDAGSVDGAYSHGERAETSASPRVNTLRFRTMAPAPAETVRKAPPAPPAVAPTPARVPSPKPEPIVRWRSAPAVEEADEIVWLMPTISRLAQRPQVEVAQQSAFLVLGNWGALTGPRYGRPAPIGPSPVANYGIGRVAADAAANWLGDRCPILMRVRPAAPRIVIPDPATARDAAAVLSATLAGMAEILRDWSIELEQAAAPPTTIPPVAEEPATPQEPAAAFDLPEPMSSLLILGL